MKIYGVIALAATLVIPSYATTLEQVLDHAADAAEKQLEVLSFVACTESVVEAKLNSKGKPENERKHSFDYFVLVESGGGDLFVNESRIEQGNGKKENKPMLHSSGFALMLLIFHPLYQPSFRFEDAGTESVEDTEYRRIKFYYVPGKRSPTLLRAGLREFPLSWMGEALVNPRTGQVRRVQAEVVAQLAQIGLKSLQTSVEYGIASNLREMPIWVPLRAEVDLQTPHQHWRNTHAFSHFKKFAVDATERVVTKPQ